MKNWAMNVIKYILFAFNLIFAISGLGIIMAGSVILLEMSLFHHFISNDIIAPCTALIVTGAIIFIISFLGFFGAIRESQKLLMAFGGLLIIVFVLELGVVITASVYKMKFQELVRESLKESMENYSEPNSEERVAWDDVQKEMMCCGVDGPNDWSDQPIPDSCCTDFKLEQDTNAFCSEHGFGTYLFQTGCFDKLETKIDSHATVVIGVGIGVALVEVIGIVLSCWLASSIRKDKYEK